MEQPLSKNEIEYAFEIEAAACTYAVSKPFKREAAASSDKTEYFFIIGPAAMRDKI